MRAILDVVLPVFGLILAGYLAGAFRILGQGSTDALNRFVYYFALPALLFVAMARVPVAQIFHWAFIAAFLGGIVAAAAIAVAVGRIAFPGRRSEQAVAGLSAAYSNSGYMGIPLFLTAFGATGLLPVLIAVVINSFMIGVLIVVIESELHAGIGPAAAVAQAARALANPLVAAPVGGIVWSALGAPLPIPLATFCDLLGAAAGPGALFALGLSLVARPLGALVRGRMALEVGWIVFVKLLVYPAITYALARIFGLEPYWTAAVTILAALPTGATGFVVASNYGVYTERASAVVLVSTVLSVITLSAVMVLFEGIGP